MIFSQFLLGMRNVSNFAGQNHSKHFTYVQKLFFENRALYEVIWKKL
jgi:hypothetical protein